MLVENKWDESGLYIKFEGAITPEDIFLTSDNYGDIKFDRIKNTIVDLTGVSEVKVNENDLNMKGSQSSAASDWNKRIQLIIVVNSEEMRQHLQPYLKVLKDLKCPWEVRIVETLEDARQLAVSYLN